MRDFEKALLNRDLRRHGHQVIVPITGPVDWSDMSGNPTMEMHTATIDFAMETVRVPIATLSFNDLRGLFYAMVVGEEVT